MLRVSPAHWLETLKLLPGCAQPFIDVCGLALRQFLLLPLGRKHRSDVARVSVLDESIDVFDARPQLTQAARGQYLPTLDLRDTGATRDARGLIEDPLPLGWRHGFEWNREDDPCPSDSVVGSGFPRRMGSHWPMMTPRRLLLPTSVVLLPTSSASHWPAARADGQGARPLKEVQHGQGPKPPGWEGRPPRPPYPKPKP
jgi:hypothetical protein